MFKSLLTSSHTFRTWLLGHLKWTLCYTVLILPKSEGHTHLAALCETCLLFTDWNVILWMSHSFNWLCYPWFRQSDKQCNNTMCIESLQIYPDSLLHANCTQYHTLIFTLISIQYTLWPVPRCYYTGNQYCSFFTIFLILSLSELTVKLWLLVCSMDLIEHVSWYLITHHTRLFHSLSHICYFIFNSPCLKM